MRPLFPSGMYRGRVVSHYLSLSRFKKTEQLTIHVAVDGTTGRHDAVVYLFLTPRAWRRTNAALFALGFAGNIESLDPRSQLGFIDLSGRECELMCMHDGGYNSHTFEKWSIIGPAPGAHRFGEVPR